MLDEDWLFNAQRAYLPIQFFIKKIEGLFSFLNSQ
jgi:hypothetical protein